MATGTGLAREARVGGRRAPIRAVGLAALIFLTVSGGPYGLEPAVGAVGGFWALALLLVVPLLWSLPVALMAGEMAATLPVLGGYYRWVREAMGEFWGFQEGWWSWLFTWVDMPLYPALAGAILQQTWPVLTGHALGNGAVVAAVVGFIWLAAGLNWLGARLVAGYAVVCSVAVLAPFFFLVARAGGQPPGRAGATAAPISGLAAPLGGLAAWGLALTTVMWNYAGWDNVATFAPSVERPRQTYPRALLLSLVGIVVIYVVPVMAGLRIDPVSAHWVDGYFITLGERAWGAPLALAMSLTAVAGAWAQYTGQLLYVMPLPEALAQDGYLPRALGRVNARGVANASLWLCTAIYSVFALAGFERLLVADVLLYSAGLGLEFLALLRLRRRRPPLESPFRVPLEGGWLAALCAAPMLLAAAMVVLAAAEDWRFTALALGMLATGPVLYPWRARVRAAGERVNSGGGKLVNGE